jgi:hypothetical protein
MVEQRSVLHSDPLAWPTAGGPWLDQNWGAQLLLYGIWRVGGFALVAVASALCTVAAWGLVVAACRRHTASLRLVAGAVLAGYLAAMPAFSARPQMFSVLLFAVQFYLLDVARARPLVAWGLRSSCLCGRTCTGPSWSGSGCSRWSSPPPGDAMGAA